MFMLVSRQGPLSRGAHRAVVVLAFALAACGDRPPATTAGGNTERDSGGVTIVENRTAEWTAERAWRVDTVPLLTIGAGEDSTQQFRYIMRGVRLGDGRVVLATDRDVRWFDSTGKSLGTLVRAGDGPGELRDVWTLLKLPGDSVLASGFYGRRLVIYDAQGKLAKDETLDWGRFAALGRWKECGGEVLADRSRVVCANDPALRDPTMPEVLGHGAVGEEGEGGWRDPGPGLLRTYTRVRLVPPTLDTSYAAGVDMGLEQYGVATPGGPTRFFRHPFHAQSVRAAGGTPLRLASATNPDYSIELFSTTGALQRIVRRIDARRAPTDLERRTAWEQMGKSARYADSAAAAEAMAQMPVPDTLPAISAMFVLPGGELLVRRGGWFEAPSIFDIFSATGHWLGHLDFPPRTRLLDAGPDYLLVLRFDEDDTPRAEVLRLHRPPA